MNVSRFATEIIDKYVKDEELRELLITHSECVARKAVQTARECGLEGDVDLQFVYDAAMLHDIGVVECDAPAIHCYGQRPYICHGIAGAEILEREGVEEAYRRVCERHTGSGLTAKEIVAEKLPLPNRDLLPETLPEKLICYADKFYSKSSSPTVEKSMERIERSLVRHGDAALERFRELRRLFTPKGKEEIGNPVETILS